MPTLRAASHAVDLPIRTEQGASEGQFRTTAVVLDADVRVCIVSCDLLCLSKDLCDRASEAIRQATGIPSEYILISCTHTHHVPMTVRVHGQEPDQGLLQAIEAAIVESATQASAYLDTTQLPNEVDADLLFACGAEATVGRNSRFLMSDGQIAWCGHDARETVRPTGPFDPQMPLVLLRRPGGDLVAGIFSHANHNIGWLSAPCSPGFYGLVAQAAEARHGGRFLFMPGAHGSSHPDDSMPTSERVHRVGEALDGAMSNLRLGLRGPVKALKAPFTYQVRQFDEAGEEADVAAWCTKWYDAASANRWMDTFRSMRHELTPQQGEKRQTWIQVMRLGDIALIGVPGELFGSLGMALKERSPYRHTVIIGLANDWIGYIPDRAGMELGGYQTWMGLHSLAEVGTGERMVDECVALLERSMLDAPDSEPAVREIRADDALGLQTFYNTLDALGRTLFRPLGWAGSYADCKSIVSEAVAGRRYDVVADKSGEIKGWAFVAGFDAEYPVFGIGVSPDLRGRGLGRELMGRTVEYVRRLEKKGIDLTVVQTNDRARSLYESFGFRTTGTLDGPDGQSYFAMRLVF